jgi:hypothetical protein
MARITADQMIDAVLQKTDRPAQYAEAGDIRKFGLPTTSVPGRYESQGYVKDDPVGSPAKEWQFIAPAPEDVPQQGPRYNYDKMQYWKILKEFMGS